MGGVMILIGILSGTLFWSDLSNEYVWFLIFVVSSFGILGGIDDFLKIKRKNSSGLSSKLKFLIQIFLTIIAIIYLDNVTDHEHLKNLYFPFFKDLSLNLGIFFIPFCVFILTKSPEE